MFRKLGIDHVHVHFANQATWTALFLKRAGFPFSFTAHAQDFMVDLGSDELLAEMAREAEFVVAVSDYSRDLLRRKCPDSAAKIHRIHNGIALDEFVCATPGESAATSHDGDPTLRIISIGRLIEFKGFHHLIDAVALLGGRGADARLDIIGDGPWRERLEARIDRLGLGGSVRLRGVLSQDQVRGELASSDVFALACCVDEKGATDVLPTVITEAMAAGLPVVSTRLAGVPELVGEGTTGLLVEPANPERLAEALARLAADRALRSRLGTAGRARCEANFSLATTSAELKALFEAGADRTPAVSTSRNAPEPAQRRVSEAPSALILIDEWPAVSTNARSSEDHGLLSELAAFSAEPVVALLAAHAGSGSCKLCPEKVEFLPDAIVLEAAWKSDPHSAAACEEWYRDLDAPDGEDYFRQARRAVHTAGLVRHRGIRHVHAARSQCLLWAWLVKKLTGIRSSFAIEARPAVSRALIEPLASEFDFGSVGDPRLSAALGGRFPDALGLAPAPKRGLFARAAAAIPDYPAWVRRMTAPADTSRNAVSQPPST